MENALICNGKVSVVVGRFAVMMMATEAPIDDVLVEPLVLPAVSTYDGELLARLAEVPAGPWLAIVLDDIDVSSLTAWDMPAYLAACQRMQAWCAAQLAAGVAAFASQPDVGAGVDKEVALALREPRGAAQTRIWQAKRLRRMLPTVWRRMRDGDLPEPHVRKLLDATAGVDDPELMAKVEEQVLAHTRAGRPPRSWPVTPRTRSNGSTRTAFPAGRKPRGRRRTSRCSRARTEWRT